jgi:hypothetical protein
MLAGIIPAPHLLGASAPANPAPGRRLLFSTFHTLRQGSSEPAIRVGIAAASAV